MNMDNDNKQRYDRMIEQVKSFDLEVDYVAGNLYGELVYITTTSDRSVGIFPFDVSPKFKTQQELVNWWENIIDIFDIEVD